MIIGRLDRVSRGYGGETVLESVSLEVRAGRRVGVIGRNGTGKTTLFRLLVGELEPEDGAVWIRPGTRVAMMEQIADFGSAETVEGVARAVFEDLHAIANEAEEIRSRLGAGEVRAGSEEEASLLHHLGELDEMFRRRGGFEIDFRVRTVLHGLGFSPEEFEKPVRVLSGGEKSRLSLARILLSAPDLLLLDEPTNHLDLGAVEWLEGYLRSWDGGLLVISHDRYLLDRVTEETVVIELGGVETYPAPYSRAMAMQADKRAQQAKRYELQRQEIARQEEFVQKNIAGQNTRQAQSRRRKLEKMERLDRPQADNRETRIGLTPRMPGGRDVLMAENLRAEIEGRVLFDGVSLHVRRGDRLGIIGPNGSGKTTLMNVLSGRRNPDGGSVINGAGILTGFLDQELRSLHDSNTVLQEIQMLRPLAQQGELRGYLARFLFQGDDVFKSVATLSGGERCRLAMARLFLEGPNLIFLDEPTNHLDIDGRQALERALADYPGTVIAVSHDRAFLNNFARSLFHVHDRGAELHLGNFDDFKARQFAEAERIVSSGADLEGSSGAQRHEERKQLKRDREKRERDRQRQQERIEEVEGEIAGVEGRMEETVAAMATPEIEPETLRALTERHRALEARRAELYARWDLLTDEAAGDEDEAPHGDDGVPDA